MTSSADTREIQPVATPSRPSARPAGRRVAGSRRRTGAAPGAARQAASAAPTVSTAPAAPRKLWLRTTPPSASRPDGPAAAVAKPARRHTRWWPSVVASVLALGLLVTALFVSTRPVLTQQERDAAVSSARTSLESLLSYSATSFDAHVAEVTPHLTSPFKDEFAKVAAKDIKPMAVKNGATVLAKVYEAGVMDTSGTGEAGTSVRVLAFVNQATTTSAKKDPAIDQNRVIATMTKVDGRWLISRLEAF